MPPADKKSPAPFTPYQKFVVASLATTWKVKQGIERRAATAQPAAA